MKYILATATTAIMLVSLVPMAQAQIRGGPTWFMFQQSCFRGIAYGPQCLLGNSQFQGQLPMRQQFPLQSQQPIQNPCPTGTTLTVLTNTCVPISTSGTAPIANAGPNQTVARNSLVTLDGTGSVATTTGTTIVTYSWFQTSGSAVSLTGANSARPTFTAPNATSVLSFSLTVTDSNGLTSTPASVSVSLT